MKQYRHKRLGWIIKEQENGYDATQPNTLITTIPKELIENSLDREEIIQKDWIDKAEKYLIVEYGWSINSNDAKKEFRTAIEKYMPRVSEEELFEIVGPLECGKELIELLKSKGLLKR